MVQLCDVSWRAVSWKILRVVGLTHRSVGVGHHIAEVVVVVVVLLLLSLGVVNEAILIGAYRNISVAWIGKFLYFEGSFNKNILDIIGKKIDLHLLILFFSISLYWLIVNMET